MIHIHKDSQTKKNSPTKLIANLALARRYGGGSPGALSPVSLRGGGNWPAHGRARHSAACILPRRRPGLPRRQRLASRPRAQPRTCRYLAAVARRTRALGLAGHGGTEGREEAKGERCRSLRERDKGERKRERELEINKSTQSASPYFVPVERWTRD